MSEGRECPQCGHLWRWHDGLNKSACLESAVGQRDHYRRALEAIAAEDYRGNKPQSVTLAERALGYDREGRPRPITPSPAKVQW